MANTSSVRWLLRGWLAFHASRHWRDESGMRIALHKLIFWQRWASHSAICTVVLCLIYFYRKYLMSLGPKFDHMRCSIGFFNSISFIYLPVSHYFKASYSNFLVIRMLDACEISPRKELLDATLYDKLILTYLPSGGPSWNLRSNWSKSWTLRQPHSGKSEKWRFHAHLNIFIEIEDIHSPNNFKLTI